MGSIEGRVAATNPEPANGFYRLIFGCQLLAVDFYLFIMPIGMTRPLLFGGGRRIPPGMRGEVRVAR